jgi:hypothetical protein
VSRKVKQASLEIAPERCAGAGGDDLCGAFGLRGGITGLEEVKSEFGGKSGLILLCEIGGVIGADALWDVGGGEKCVCSSSYKKLSGLPTRPHKAGRTRRGSANYHRAGAAALCEQQWRAGDTGRI